MANKQHLVNQLTLINQIICQSTKHPYPYLISRKDQN